MTINEIAQLAGVSISTVSKIVNNKDEHINSETRKRVLNVVKEYNYTPYGMVKSASEARTFTLGVLLRSAARANRFLNGLIQAAQESGYSVLVYDSAESPENELKHITSLCQKKADGVIWQPVDAESLKFRRHLDKENIEICFINSCAEPTSHSIDFSSMGYCAAETLLQYGHTRLGCLTKNGSGRSDLVFEGFKKCLFDHSIPFQPSMKLSVETDAWYDTMLSHTITGIVSSHYASSLILMEHLSKMQVRVPFDLSLVSLRDDAREIIHFPAISSMKIPYYEFGAFVCQRLIEKCEKKEPAASVFDAPCVLDNTRSLDIPFTSHTKKIIVVGSINIDITLNVDQLPQPGCTVSTSKHSIIPGGKGANQAVGVAKLGCEAALIGKVGSDYDSTLVYACMEENHVDIQGLKRTSNVGTGKAYIHVQDDGESMITILSGANEQLKASDITSYEHLFQSAGYCLLQTEVPEASIEAAAEMARKYGVKNILKPAAMTKLSPALMTLTDIFVPNRKEAELLCPGISDVEGKAEAFMKQGAKTVIITLGHRGCFIKSPEFTGYLPASDIAPIDTTGAADAFIAALAVYLSLGHSIQNAARIATYAAGFCVSRQGVIPALIDRNSLETYLNRTEPQLLAETEPPA